MKIYIEINSPEGTDCILHPGRPATYSVETVLFNHRIAKPMCDDCLCRHSNVQVFMSVEEGLELPQGMRHAKKENEKIVYQKT